MKTIEQITAEELWDWRPFGSDPINQLWGDYWYDYQWWEATFHDQMFQMRALVWDL